MGKQFPIGSSRRRHLKIVPRRDEIPVRPPHLAGVLRQRAVRLAERSYPLRNAECALEEIEESVEEGLAGVLADHDYVVALQLRRLLAAFERLEIVLGHAHLTGGRLAI